MTVSDYIKILKQQWMFIAGCVAVGVMVAAGVATVIPIKYTAVTSIYISAQNGNDAMSAYQGSLLSQERVKSYTQLIQSERVGSEVARELNLNESPEDITKQVAAQSQLDTVVIDISATDESPTRAALIANAVGTTFPRLVAELERPTDVNALPTVVARVVQPASIPTEASSTSLTTILALGILAGAGVGLVSAVVRNALDKRVKSVEDLGDILHAPNLGVLASDQEASKSPLVLRREPNSPKSEAYRQLRTNLQYIDIDTPRKVITVTSSIPGEGKSTTVANLALVIASTGRRVLLVDADLRRPSIGRIFGLDKSVGLTTVLSGRSDLKSSIQSWAGTSLSILTSGSRPPNPSELLGSRNMQNLLTELKNNYDLVLIDAPPILPVSDPTVLTPYTDGALLVCRSQHVDRQQVAQAERALQAVSANLLGSILISDRAARKTNYGAYFAHTRLDGESTQKLNGVRTNGRSKSSPAIRGNQSEGA